MYPIQYFSGEFIAKAMASRYRLNSYNWFGQQLMTRHQYSEIINLRRRLSSGTDRPVSDHLNYLTCLSLMKTGTHLDEIINNLQEQLQFDKNQDYLLLLCRCLLYLGNYDSVVEICKQLIKKELDDVFLDQTVNWTDDEEASKSTDQHQQVISSTHSKRSDDKMSLLAHQESFEFQGLLARISVNHLIGEPRLWLIFSHCLEYKRRFKDAHHGFKLAASLALNKASKMAKEPLDQSLGASPDDNLLTAVATQYDLSPHLKYAESCIKLRQDFRAAYQALNSILPLFPQNYRLRLLLASIMNMQAPGGRANLAKAIEIISASEAHYKSNQNPARKYNEIAMHCLNQIQPRTYILEIGSDEADETSSPISLSHLLIKSHLMVANIVQGSSLLNFAPNSDNLGLKNQANKLIESLKSSESICWNSASFWNNLGTMYMFMKRHVASLSCMIQAQLLDPSNWRINYNLAMAYLHVSLTSRSLVHLLSAKNFLKQSRNGSRAVAQQLSKDQNLRMINILLAICYDSLGELDDARRLYVELTHSDDEVYCFETQVCALINYLIFLHKSFKGKDERLSKLKLHLLDRIEQCWLQRDQNDRQFNNYLLGVASRIGDEVNTEISSSGKKSYAWSKFDLS